MKILIAEDDKMCQGALKNFCKKASIECDVANNGVEALGFCEKGGVYDFVLMDMYMPEMNGDIATGKIRALDHGSSYNIILLTGVEEMNEDDAIKLGFTGLQKKPMNKVAFGEIVKRFTK